MRRKENQLQIENKNKLILFLLLLCSPASRQVQMLTKRLSTLRAEKSSLLTELTVELGGFALGNVSSVKPWMAPVVQ